jgi:sarcosine oxidase subunit alpha
VGKRSLSRPDVARPGRKQLVGLLTRDARSVLEEGAQVVASPRAARGSTSDGHVSSSYFSVALGRPIALALITDGRNRIGSTVYISMPNGSLEAEVVSPVFYDPEGARINV